MRGIECVSVRIIRMLFDFAADHALRLARGRQLQKFTHFFLRQETGRAMRTVRENVKPARVVRVLVAGEPDIALLRDEADDEDNHQRRHNSEAGEYRSPVLEGVQHPDAFDFFLATLFHFMQRQEYLSALLQRRALVPRYCQENIAYLNLEICNIFLGCTVTIKQYAAPTRKKIAESS